MKFNKLVGMSLWLAAASLFGALSYAQIAPDEVNPPDPELSDGKRIENELNPVSLAEKYGGDSSSEDQEAGSEQTPCSGLNPGDEGYEEAVEAGACD